MAFEDAKYFSPASHHDVATTAIAAAVAIDKISRALEKLAEKLNVDISGEITELSDQSRRLSNQFIALTGYTSE